MVSGMEQKRLRDLIVDTVTVLCQSSLQFTSRFSVEGLLGITVDDKDVFLINIHEVIASQKGKRQNAAKVKSVRVNNKECAALSQSHAVVACTESLTMQTATEPLSKLAYCSQPQYAFSCDQLDDQITHSFKHEHVQSHMPLPADNESSLETSLSLSARTDINHLLTDNATEVCETQNHDLNTDNKEHVLEFDDVDSRLDYVDQDLLTECNSIWPDKQDTDIQGSAVHSCGSPLETSKESELLHAGHAEEDSTSFPLYRIISGGNARGGVAMVSTDGHRYGIKMIKPNVTYWRCVVRNRLYNCGAVVIQRGNTFIRGGREHCHLPQFAASAFDDE